MQWGCGYELRSGIIIMKRLIEMRNGRKNRKIVVVVGAGASNDVGLPLGSELKNYIAGKLRFRFDIDKQIGGDRTINQALHLLCKNVNQNQISLMDYQKAANTISEAMPLAESIDNYIHVHKNDTTIELCGKLAIVKTILEAERASPLNFRKNDKVATFSPSATDNTWYNQFFIMLTNNCRVEELGQRFSSIKLIIFNYDQCIEHFIYHSLPIAYYEIDQYRAAEIVKGMEIYHPYGTVGNLPWYSDAHTIEFGEEPRPHQLLDLADQIKTFTEGTDPTSSDIIAIRKGVLEADIVLFLGFAYHKLNLELIKPWNMTSAKRKILYLGAAVGISDEDIELISYDLHELCSGKTSRTVKLRNDLENCLELFKQHSRTLRL